MISNNSQAPDKISKGATFTKFNGVRYDMFAVFLLLLVTAPSLWHHAHQILLFFISFLVTDIFWLFVATLLMMYLAKEYKLLNGRKIDQNSWALFLIGGLDFWRLNPETKWKRAWIKHYFRGLYNQVMLDSCCFIIFFLRGCVYFWHRVVLSVCVCYVWMKQPNVYH